MDKSNTILVTGATGQQGGAVARELLSAGYTIKVMTRKPEGEKAQELAKLGAEVVQGDLDNLESVRKAVNGAWGVFAIQNTWEAGVEKEEEQGKNFAKIAKEEGVQHYVYTSVASSDRKTGIPHFENKYRVEQTVIGLGFPSYTILRPVFFMENWLTPWFKPAIDEGNLAVAIKPETKLQMVAVEDIGKYGLWAFRDHEKLNGRVIEIAGDELTMPETADAINSTNGRKVDFFQVPIEEVRKFSEDFALMLEWFDRVGYDADIEKTAGESGIKPTRFSEWASQISW
jgi:uncharacterized protein YbjT (DUF2867 family)